MGEGSQHVGYKLPPPRRPVLAEPQGLQGPFTPTRAHQTLRENRAGITLRSTCFPPLTPLPGALWGGMKLGGTF